MVTTTEIAQLARQAVEVLQPYLPALATSAATAAGKEAPDAVRALWQAIRDRLSRREAGREAVEDIITHPGDPAYLTVFLVQVQKALAQDAAFLAEVRRLLEAAQGETTYRADQSGSGTIAQGPGAKAVGERGVLIEGDVQDSIILTGDDNELTVGG